MRVLKINETVAKPQVPTTAGDFCFCRKVRRGWLQGKILRAHRGFRGRFGLLELAEDLKARQKQERAAVSPRKVRCGEGCWLLCLTKSSKPTEGKPFPHV